MKKKIVIKVSMHDEKCRSKALQTAVCIPGVESAALTGPDKTQLEVEGDGIDSVVLTRRLRKKFAQADLEIVSDVKKEDKSAEKKDDATEQPTVAPPCVYGLPGPYYCCEVMREPSICTIL